MLSEYDTYKSFHVLDLPNKDNRFLNRLDKGNVTDAFVETLLDDLTIAATHCIVDDLEPKWNESYSLDVCHYVKNVHKIFVNESCP